jgi:hypothetical protein
MEFVIKSIKKFRFEYLLILLPVIFMGISLINDMYTSTSTLFSRSGSMLVLFAAVVEFRISNIIYNDIWKATFLNKKIDISTPLKAKPQKEKVILSYVTHSQIICGTVIWGYGDLLFTKA